MNDLDHQYTDADFQQYFERFGKEPSNKVWAGLESQLTARKVALQRQRRVKILVGALALLLLVLIFLLAGSGQTPDKQVALQKQQMTHSTAASSANKSATNTSLEQANSLQNKQQAHTAMQSTAQWQNNRKSILQATAANSLTAVQPNTSDVAYTVAEEQPNTAFEFTVMPKIDLTSLPVLPNHKKTQDQQVAALQKKHPFVESIHLKKRKKNGTNWLISSWIGYNQYSRSIRTNAQYASVSSPTVAFFNAIEHSDPNWSVGLDLGYTINKNWRLETGIALHNFRMQARNYDFQVVYNEQQASESILITSYNTNRIQLELAETTDLEDGDLVLLQGFFQQQIRSVSVPLMIRYSILKNRLGVQLAAGLSANFALGDSQLNWSNSGTPLRSFRQVFAEKSAKTHLGYAASFRALYRLNTQYALFMGPQIRGALTPANQKKPIEFFPRSWGLQLGFEKHF